ncbi:hypothetical protein HYH02_011655 [Chlamydomonas schloesseri]|uniref:Aminotransferase class I/classII large domain-containing protein n=1 Tax=Chlamydomonas schloesseri TaxID=2026947 RepID=A0A835W553_9CHLO|nr:hypothetical protein HYH02_011655 [Chlamydomonas schloesseri]|eukprot:KAG2436151.1 hypothetical protein HYH02_011655 [Chlamydomonas schloesseri]
MAENRLPGHLSSRAGRAIRPALSYFKAFMDAKDRQWKPEDPEGNIILTVAENRISSDIVRERLSRAAADFPEEALTYQDMRGIPALRQALARLLEGTFMKGIDVDPDQLSVSAGAGAIIENLFHCIAGAGDVVLIPAPYYPAFDNDLQVKCGVVPHPFHLDEDRPLGPQLNAAAEAALEAVSAASGSNGSNGSNCRGPRVAAVLFTSPNNPLGTMYSRDTVVELLRWCLQREVHCVSDEIYGNSVFGQGATFTSAEVIARQEAANLPHADRLPDLLHVVWGMSKDFCASGIRVGVLHSRNVQLNKALDNLGYFAAVSNPVQWALAEALNDGPWLADFLATNRLRMAAAYGQLEAALTEAGIPHVPADSAMFCWVDLRAWLPEPSWAGEAALWEEMCKECRVLLTPGEQCHAAEPGFFRVCWAWMPGDSLPVAVRRLAAHFGAKQKQQQQQQQEEQQQEEQ